MRQVFPDIEALNRFAAETFIEIGSEAIKQNGFFLVVLSGGSTPKSLYRLLASEKFANRIVWTKVYFFFGDERNVLPDDEESNFRMARENLLEPLKIPDINIFRWRTELIDAAKIAADYEKESIIDFFSLEKDEYPRFDLILLGMGADGHTASLFPNTEALNETERLAVANKVEKLETSRLTLTFPVINSASNAMFLVAGADKAETLQKVLEGDYKPDEFPSQKVKLNDGNLFWLIDSQAAQLLQ